MSSRYEAAIDIAHTNNTHAALVVFTGKDNRVLELGAASGYMTRALRERGNNYLEMKARTAPHVLSFGVEVIPDGRSLPRPVNYALVRVLPPEGVVTDSRKRPFIVFDPRAGHGPGIGGMKHDSEIGVALAAGHPCYFVGFLPEPVPGQTSSKAMPVQP